MLSDLGVRTTFLDDLATFERLKIKGISERHQRLKMHRVLFTAARLWRWFSDKQRLRQEWLQIIFDSPQRIGCSVAEALADMLRRSQQSPDFSFHLPNTKFLPRLTKREIKLLQKRLQDRGCTDPVSASRIIAKVLYPAPSRNARKPASEAPRRSRAATCSGSASEKTTSQRSAGWRSTTSW